MKPYMAKEEMLLHIKRGSSIVILSELNDCSTKDILDIIGPENAGTKKRKSVRRTIVYDETTGEVYVSRAEASENIGCESITDVSREFAKQGVDRIWIHGHVLRRKKRKK